MLACCVVAVHGNTAHASLSPERLVETGYLRALSKTRTEERLPEGWTKSFDDMFDIRGLVDPDGVKVLTTKNGAAMYADRLAGDDLYALAVAYRADTGLTLRTISAYRSTEEQAFLYAKYSARGDEMYSTPPGTSEHHLGTAFDFGLGEGDVHYSWLADHAIDYGFVQSYTAGCRERTGVTEEEWHYRWIGRELAAEYVNRRDASTKAYCAVDFYADKWQEFDTERRLATARAAALRAEEEASRTMPINETLPTKPSIISPANTATTLSGVLASVGRISLSTNPFDAMVMVVGRLFGTGTTIPR
ncbi:MAG TPA: M15 family metallopeptidase [bacterium]|nr:M15 family metallopeptidase [bacterium]